MVSNQISAEGEIRPKASLFRGQRGRGRDMIWNTLCIETTGSVKRTSITLKSMVIRGMGIKRSQAERNERRDGRRDALQRKRDWNAWGKYKQAVFSLFFLFPFSSSPSLSLFLSVHVSHTRMNNGYGKSFPAVRDPANIANAMRRISGAGDDLSGKVCR